MAKSVWFLPHAGGEARELASARGLSEPAARVLITRGFVDPASARAFLAPSLRDLGDPFGLRDMDRAVERLLRAISAREKILIYGDYDVDGTSSVVLLTKAIELVPSTS